MPETVFSKIIASCLVLVEAIVGKFVVAPTWDAGNILNCAPAGYTGGSLTECGTALVLQIPQLAVTGVGFINGLLAALNLAA